MLFLFHKFEIRSCTKYICTQDIKEKDLINIDLHLQKIF